MANGDSRIAVLLPHGVLFRGASEEIIRKYLVKDLNVIDAIIGLPANCFQGTGIPVCCIVLKKERNGNSNNICFIDASHDYVDAKTQNYLSDEHIEKIINAYADRKEIDKYCHIAYMKELEENDYNLNIPRYVDSLEEDEIINIPAVRQEIVTQTQRSAELDKKIADIFNELGL